MISNTIVFKLFTVTDENKAHATARPKGKKDAIELLNFSCIKLEQDTKQRSLNPKEAATLRPVLEQKTGCCLWRASHCWTDSDRERLVQEISQYVNVTVQGKCKDQV